MGLPGLPSRTSLSRHRSVTALLPVSRVLLAFRCSHHTGPVLQARQAAAGQGEEPVPDNRVTGSLAWFVQHLHQE
jgi:hypothetical protein